jgi:hypothetical protein
MVNGKMVAAMKGEATVAVALGIVQDVETGEERKTSTSFLIDAFGQTAHQSRSTAQGRRDLRRTNGKVGYGIRESI